jgi:hypothetical protein
MFQNHSKESKFDSEKIKSTLNSDNVCYHSVQNLMSSQLLPKDVKIKIHKTIILPVVIENRVSRISIPERDEIIGA